VTETAAAVGRCRAGGGEGLVGEAEGAAGVAGERGGLGMPGGDGAPASADGGVEQLAGELW